MINLNVSDVKEKLIEKLGTYRNPLGDETIKEILFEMHSDDVINIHTIMSAGCLIGEPEYDASVLKQKIIDKGGALRVEQVRDTEHQTETGAWISGVDAFNHLVINDDDVFVYLKKSNIIFSNIICVGDTKPISSMGYYPPTKDLDKIAVASETEKERLMNQRTKAQDETEGEDDDS